MNERSRWRVRVTGSEAGLQQPHLSGVTSIPLDRLRDEIARLAPSREQPLLLRCLRGTRIGAGEATLKKMGYRKVFNLGSYGRAEQIPGGSGPS